MITTWKMFFWTLVILLLAVTLGVCATETYIQTYVFPDDSLLYCPCGGPPPSLSSCEGSNYYGFIETGPSFPYAVGVSTVITVGLSAEKQDPCQAQSNVYVYAKWSSAPIINAASPIQNCGGAACAAPCDSLMTAFPDWKLLASVQNVGRGGWDYCPGALGTASTSVAEAQSAGLTGTLYYLNILACDEEYAGNCSGGATFAANFIGSNSATTLASYAYSIPPPPCGANALCGHVSAIEDSTLMVPNVYLELRNLQGNVVGTTKTASNGAYAFNGLTTGSSYTIDAVLENMETVLPHEYKEAIPSPITSDFSVLSVPVEVTLQGSPGDFVALTTAPIVGSAPPHESYTAVVDGSGTILIKAPVEAHYATRWHRDPVSGGYVKGSSTDLGHTVPMQHLSVVTP